MFSWEIGLNRVKFWLVAYRLTDSFTGSRFLPIGAAGCPDGMKNAGRTGHRRGEFSGARLGPGRGNNSEVLECGDFLRR